MKTKTPLILKLCLFSLIAIVAMLTKPHYSLAGGRPGSDPIDQLKQTVDQLTTIMGDNSLASKDRRMDRRQKIIQVVDHRFNFKLMSKLALGKHWEEIGPNYKELFSSLFADLLKNTYIRRVEAYSDEQVVFSDQVIKKNVAMVRSSFLKNNASLSIDYKLRKEGSQWMVFDVIIEGASIIKQYRRQFSTILKKESIGELIARLKEKVEAQEQI